MCLRNVHKPFLVNPIKSRNHSSPMDFGTDICLADCLLSAQIHKTYASFLSDIADEFHQWSSIVKEQHLEDACLVRKVAGIVMSSYCTWHSITLCMWKFTESYAQVVYIVCLTVQLISQLFLQNCLLDINFCLEANFTATCTTCSYAIL